MRLRIITRHQEPDPSTPRGRRRIRKAKVNVWQQRAMAKEYVRRFLHGDLNYITQRKSWVTGKTLNVEVTVSLPGELTVGELGEARRHVGIPPTL